MSLDNVLTAFAPKLRNVAYLCVSLYTLSFLCSVVGYGKSGLDNLSRLATILNMDKLSGWFSRVSHTLKETDSYEPAISMILTMWLLVSIVLLVNDFSPSKPELLYQYSFQSVFGYMFSWTLFSDTKAPNPIFNIATCSLIVALIIIFFLHRSENKNPWIPLLNILAFFITTPIYVILALPLWLASRGFLED